MKRLTTVMAAHYQKTGGCPWCGKGDMMYGTEDGFENGEAWVLVECSECGGRLHELFKQYGIGDPETGKEVYRIPEEER